VATEDPSHVRAADAPADDRWVVRPPHGDGGRAGVISWDVENINSNRRRRRHSLDADCPPLYDNNRQKLAVVRASTAGSSSANGHGAKLIVLCRQGFELERPVVSAIIECRAAEWTPVVPMCVPSESRRTPHAIAAEACTLPMRHHAFYLHASTIRQQNETIEHSATARMYCLRGYETLGHTELVCNLGAFVVPAGDCRPSEPWTMTSTPLQGRARRAPSRTAIGEWRLYSPT